MVRRKKREHSKKNFHTLKFDKEESELIGDFKEELDDEIFSQRVRDSYRHKFYEVNYQKSNLKFKNTHTYSRKDGELCKI